MQQQYQYPSPKTTHLIQPNTNSNYSIPTFCCCLVAKRLVTRFWSRSIQISFLPRGHMMQWTTATEVVVPSERKRALVTLLDFVSKHLVLLSPILTLFISLTISSLFPPVECNYMLFIFHPILTPASMSSHPTVLIMYSLYRLKGPDNTTVPYTFLDWEPFCYVLFKFHFAFLLCVYILY